MLTKMIVAVVLAITLGGCAMVEVQPKFRRCYSIARVHGLQDTLFGKPIGEPHFDVTLNDGTIVKNVNAHFIDISWSGKADAYCPAGIPAR